MDVPPVLPTFQAILLKLGGINFTVIVVAFLQNVTLILTGWLVLRAVSRRDRPHAPVGLGLYFATTWSFFASCYQFTHDAWLVMLLLDTLVYLADRLWARTITRRTAIVWDYSEASHP